MLFGESRFLRSVGSAGGVSGGGGENEWFRTLLGPLSVRTDIGRFQLTHNPESARRENMRRNYAPKRPVRRNGVPPNPARAGNMEFGDSWRRSATARCCTPGPSLHLMGFEALRLRDIADAPMERSCPMSSRDCDDIKRRRDKV